MADVAISIVASLVERLLGPAIREGKCFLCVNKFIGDLENEKQELVIERDNLLDRVEQAKHRTEEIEKPVEMWLNDVKNLLEQVEDLEQMMRENTSCFQGQCPTWKRYRLCKQIVKKIELIGKFKGKSNIQPFSHRAPLPGIQYPSSENFIYFESTKVANSELLEALQDDDIYMIGVYGMGGTGKTTLVTEVAKKVEASKIFDKAILVTVSQTPNIRDIQGRVADVLNLKLEEESDEGRAQRLWLNLKEKKRMLVIIDDLWREFNLNDIGIHLDNHNKGAWKILVTTRNQHICDLMHCQKKIHLELLSEDESWTLFKKHAHIDETFSKSLDGVPQKICRECKGLPIAIKAVGSSLKGKSDAEWKVAFHRLTHSETIDDHMDGVGDALSCLKLSYDYLSYKEKLIFLLCSMFPEDYKISIEDLIRYAVGLGLGGEFPLDSARDEIEATTNRLLQSCLLMNAGESKECVKMHDTVRDTALWIAKRSENHKIVVNVDKQVSELVMDDNIIDCFALSSWYDKQDQKFHQLHAPNLEILLVHSRRRKSFDLSRATFQGVKGLKVFSLIYNGYGDPSLSLPSSTHSLTNLRTLRLNGWKLDNILFITNLTRLEILDLRHCIINELPKEIGKLNRLKLLDMSYCRFLEENYNAAIGKLSKLEELYAFKCMPKEYIYQCAVDIITLPRLQRFVIHADRSRDFAKTSRHLEVMDFNISNMKASTKNLLQIAETVHFINLHGGCKTIMPDMIGVMGGVSCFKSLCLEGCSEIEYIFNTASDSKLECLVPELVELVLLRLENLEELCRGPPQHVLSFFERLEKLEIQQCLKLHNIFPQDCNLRNLKVLKIENNVFGEALFSISVAHNLQQLEVLEVAQCDELKFIIATGSEDGSNSNNEIFQTPIKSSHFVMSGLKKLHISKCKKLESLLPICCVEGFAPLEEIQIKKAPHLKLVFGECDHQNHSSQQYPNQNLHPYLKRLKLTDLDNLIGICPENNCEKWPSSTVLIVENCPKLSASWIATLAGSEDREKVVKIEKMTLSGFSGLSLISRVGPSPRHILNLHCLQRLAVSNCNNLRSLFSMEQLHRSLPELTSFRVYSCHELEQIIEESEKFVSNTEVCFPKLKDIKIVNCKKMKSLFSVAMIRMLPKLSTLEMSEVTQLEEVFKGGNTITNDVAIGLVNLSKIELHKLPSFVDICKGFKLQTPKIKHLDIVECPSISPSLREIQVQLEETKREGKDD
ncbi:putative disease resistance protein At5g05400 [Trifolium pratense]|uniref:putative disease resistance protein At5g05400 n=1 Tax=Trifolium pratense TaxID=57577 RepID=UPI001E6927B8|nr:putative disease resistance protein At5g05400 [Trifolium pratense]XP_045800625.1 putative disease resistance protein At5g05400 [Trifolium pratense]